MVNHYHFGTKTGVEQGYEASGYIPDPKKGYGLNIQYANTSFGQGMTATPIQMATALSGLINGGTYYKPHLVDRYIAANGTEELVKPQTLGAQVVNAQTSKEVKELMEYVVDKNFVLYGFKKTRPEYSIGGKTGTAQIAQPGGGYYADKFNGLFMGFVGGDEPQYVVVVTVNEPTINGYAGAKAAAPIFAAITNMLIDNFGVTPKS